MTTSWSRPWPAIPNAISYFGYAYYVQNKDKIKAVGVDGGKGCIEPTEATINDGTYAPLSRPLFIYPNTTKAKASPALYAFVSFYLANAAELSRRGRLRAGPGRPRRTAAGQLEHGRPAVTRHAHDDAPADVGRPVRRSRFHGCARLIVPTKTRKIARWPPNRSS